MLAAVKGINRLNTPGTEAKADKRRRIVDLEKCVVQSNRSTEEMNEYIREMRDSDRI